jgi:hypothetical protein
MPTRIQYAWQQLNQIKILRARYVNLKVFPSGIIKNTIHLMGSLLLKLNGHTLPLPGNGQGLLPQNL